MRYVCLLALLLPALSSAQASPSEDGAAIYKERGASGHGSMKSRAEGLAINTIFAGDVPKLKLMWAFNLGDATMARSEPAIIGGRAFIATLTGAGATLYTLTAKTGDFIRKIRPVDHFATTVTAAARFYKNVIYRSLAVILVFDLMFFIQSRKRDLL